MIRRRKSRSPRPVRGALLAIGALFFASGVLRLADGTGLALARGVETLTAPQAAAESPPPMVAQECSSGEDLTLAVARLRERMAAIEAREKEIEYRKVTLDRAEAEIRRNLDALVEAEEALSATIARADGAAEQDIDRLVAVYERMKPKDAAAMFEAMDPTFAAGFLGRMRPEVAAEVMAGMSPTRAYTVSILLAGRNSAVPTE